MSNIKEELCYAMRKFVKEHIDEMNRPASDLSIEWKNEKQMLRDIRKNFSDAVWALGELLTNYMSKDYCSELFVVDRYVDDDDYEQEICRIIDRKGKERYIRPIYPDEDVVEVELGTRVVNVWKDK